MEEFRLEKNERRKRDIVSYCKNELFDDVLNGNGGKTQIIGNRLAEKYPNDLVLILEAVEEILKYNRQSTGIKMQEFVNLMADYDHMGKYNWHDVHTKFKNRFVD